MPCCVYASVVLNILRRRTFDCQIWDSGDLMGVNLSDNKASDKTKVIPSPMKRKAWMTKFPMPASPVLKTDTHSYSCFLSANNRRHNFDILEAKLIMISKQGTGLLKILSFTTGPPLVLVTTDSIKLKILRLPLSFQITERRPTTLSTAKSKPKYTADMSCKQYSRKIWYQFTDWYCNYYDMCSALYFSAVSTGSVQAQSYL